MRFAALSLDTARLVAGTVGVPTSLDDGGAGTAVTAVTVGAAGVARAGFLGKADRR